MNVQYKSDFTQVSNEDRGKYTSLQKLLAAKEEESGITIYYI